jgi:hypothetical protein
VLLRSLRATDEKSCRIQSSAMRGSGNLCACGCSNRMFSLIRCGASLNLNATLSLDVDLEKTIFLWSETIMMEIL